MNGWLKQVGRGRSEHEQATVLLSAYMDRQVNARERALVERHLSTCDDCRGRLNALRAMVQAVRVLPAQPLPRSFTLPRSMARQPRPSWTFPIFRAATVVATVLLVVVMAGDLAGLSKWLAPSSPTYNAQPLMVAMESSTVSDAEPKVETATGKEKGSPDLPEAQHDVQIAITPTEAQALSGAVAPPVEVPLGGVGGMGDGRGAGLGGGEVAGAPTARIAVEPALDAGIVSNTGLVSNAIPTPIPEVAWMSATERQLTPSQPPVAIIGALPSPQPQPGNTPSYNSYDTDSVEESVSGQRLLTPLRWAEIGLGGLALLLGIFSLVSSGRLRPKVR